MICSSWRSKLGKLGGVGGAAHLWGPVPPQVAVGRGAARVLGLLVPPARGVEAADDRLAHLVAAVVAVGVDAPVVPCAWDARRSMTMA